MRTGYGFSLWALAKRQAEKVLDVLLLDWGGTKAYNYNEISIFIYPK